jgi:hypothetical protein
MLELKGVIDSTVQILWLFLSALFGIPLNRFRALAI